MDQEVDFEQHANGSINSDISSDYSFKSDKMLHSISNLSMHSVTSSKLDYVHELSFLFKKIHRDLKFIEIEEAYTMAVANKKHSEIFDWNLFVKLLLQILEGLGEKLEYVLCLETMLQDRSLILKHLGCADTEKVYNTLKFEESEGKLSRNTISPKVMEITRTLLTSIGLMKEVPRYRNKMHPNSKRFLELYQEFYRIMKIKCEMVAPKELLKDKMFHEMYRNNQRICEKIREIEQSIKREEAKVEIVIQSKMDAVQEFRAKLDVLKRTIEVDINAQIQQSQKEMNVVYENSKIEQNQLMTQVNKTRKQYNDILTGNLRMENEIRERKGIAQQQLRSWLNRYDKDIGERTAELTSLENRKTARQEEFDKWEIQFNEQETEYLALMEKKEMEDKKRIEEKMLMFLMNRSAIIIQRAWRKYLGRRKKQKKKGKKGKK